MERYTKINMTHLRNNWAVFVCYACSVHGLWEWFTHLMVSISIIRFLKLDIFTILIEKCVCVKKEYQKGNLS